jgi:hypothetical protein
LSSAVGAIALADGEDRLRAPQAEKEGATARPAGSRLRRIPERHVGDEGEQRTMDDDRFDRLTRRIGGATTRR